MDTVDATLVRAAQGGDRGAFERLVEEHHLRLRAYTARFVAEPADALDLVQDAFIRAWRSLADLDPARPVWPWLRTIARNLVIDHLRRRQRRPEHPLAHLEQEAAAETPEAADAETGRQAAAISALQGCLEELDPANRDLVQRRFHLGEPVQAIAEALGLRANSLSMRLTRLRDRLRTCMDQRLEADHA